MFQPFRLFLIGEPDWSWHSFVSILKICESVAKILTYEPAYRRGHCRQVKDISERK
jgi:hypothetical protein